MSKTSNASSMLELLKKSKIADDIPDEKYPVPPRQVLLLPWTPTDVFYHITQHHNLIMNDVLFFRSMLKNIAIKIHNESLYRVHPKEKNILGLPMKEVDKNQCQTLIMVLNTWHKFVNLPKNVIQQQDIERHRRLHRRG